MKTSLHVCTAPLGGLLLLKGRENLRCSGECKWNTFPELAHPDTEIGMCSLPAGLRGNVLLCSNGTSE